MRYGRANMELDPKISSELARDIYTVQSELEFKFFLKARDEFTDAPEGKAKLTANVGGHIIRSASDGFGVCALGSGDYSKDIFIIFRGSTDANRGADWVSNFKIGTEISETGFAVHVGFNNIFKSMRQDILTFLNENTDRTGNIHCIGHSLGGAIATIAADWVKSIRKSQEVKVYTFGAPKPAMMMFSSQFTRKLQENNIKRVYHATDPVPMIPLFPFIHAPFQSNGHYISSNETILSADAHDMKKYCESVKLSSWEDLTRRAPSHGIEDGIEEFLRSKSPVDASSAKTWQMLNSALIWVLKKGFTTIAHLIQPVITGIVSLADKLAYLLTKIKDIKFPTWDGSVWLFRLIAKMMQALGMAVVKNIKEMTIVLIKNVIY